MRTLALALVLGVLALGCGDDAGSGGHGGGAGAGTHGGSQGAGGIDPGSCKTDPLETKLVAEQTGVSVDIAELLDPQVDGRVRGARSHDRQGDD